MALVQNASFILLTLPGVFSGIFKASCDENLTGQCGDNITGTCDADYPIDVEVILKDKYKTLMKMNLELKSVEKHVLKDDKFSIEVTEDRKHLTLTIHNANFIDESIYKLYMFASNGDINSKISVKVDGACEPVTEIVEDELRCEVESLEELPIRWMDNHRKVYPGKSTTINQEPPKRGYKLVSSLKLTDDNRNIPICCSVFDVKEKTTCMHRFEGVHGVPESKKMSYVIFPVIAFLVIGCLVSYFHFDRRRKSRERSFSQDPFLEEGESQENCAELSSLEPA